MSETQTATAHDAAPRELTLRVFRGDKSGGQEVEYRVPIEPGMVVLDAIHWIQAHAAPDLACRWNCKAARCGSCSAEINGRPKLMCKTRLDRDLVLDLFALGRVTAIDLEDRFGGAAHRVLSFAAAAAVAGSG